MGGQTDRHMERGGEREGERWVYGQVDGWTDELGSKMYGCVPIYLRNLLHVTANFVQITTYKSCATVTHAN